MIIFSKEEIRRHIREKYKQIFSELESRFNKKKNIKEFINFILQNYPYTDYQKDKKTKIISTLTNNQELVEYLRKKYQSDLCKEPQAEDEKSQLIYYIVEVIESYLNKIYENI